MDGAVSKLSKLNLEELTLKNADVQLQAHYDLFLATGALADTNTPSRGEIVRRECLEERRAKEGMSGVRILACLASRMTEDTPQSRQAAPASRRILLRRVSILARRDREESQLLQEASAYIRSPSPISHPRRASRARRWICKVEWGVSLRVGRSPCAYTGLSGRASRLAVTEKGVAGVQATGSPSLQRRS